MTKLPKIAQAIPCECSAVVTKLGRRVSGSNTRNTPRCDAKEIEQGEIYKDGLARVSAFLVDHGTVKPAFGYRIDSAGHSVVISGDTKFCQNLVDFAKGADCLIHAA